MNSNIQSYEFVQSLALGVAQNDINYLARLQRKKEELLRELDKIEIQMYNTRHQIKKLSDFIS